MRPTGLRLFIFVVTSVLLAIVSSVHSSVAYAQTINHCGTLRGNEIWSAGTIHTVGVGSSCGDVTVPVNLTLTIEAGAIIKLDKDADIVVSGRLIAQGTVDKPIYFTSYHDDGSDVGGNTDGVDITPLMGDWGHIVFNQGTDDSILSRAVIRYSGYDGNCCSVTDGAIYLNKVSPSLSYITFNHNYINGIELAGGDWPSMTWDNTTVVYVLEEGDLNIPAANTLTIVPGMKIKLASKIDFNVSGKLLASGTSTAQIFFSSINDDTLCGKGAFGEDDCDIRGDGTNKTPLVSDWGHILFNRGSDESTITRAVIRYSGYDGNCCSATDGAIYLNKASPSLSYITFEDNYINGVELAGGDWPSTTWDNTTMVYVLEEGDLNIPAANTLTIVPAMKLKLGSKVDINVSGKLIATGTSSEPIYFSSRFDDTLCGKSALDEDICDTHNDDLDIDPLVNDWGQIQFNIGSDDSIITRAVIRYSGDDGSCCSNDGAIHLNKASPSLSHISFEDNYINGVEILGGDWSTDTWDNTTIVYFLKSSDLNVPASQTLTIAPGMKIKLGSKVDLNVSGKLIATGTSAEPIYFSSINDDTLCGKGALEEEVCDTFNNGSTIAPLVNDWGQIQFNENSDDSSIITRAIIRYGGDDGSCCSNDGAIFLSNASPTISYTELTNNYRGIEALGGSTPTLVCNDIYNNTNLGIYNNTPATIVRAEGHWWGTTSGPILPGNPGAQVSEGVDYTPWATESCIENSGPDTTAPVVTEVSAIPQATSATITWKTDEPATGQVTYGMNTPDTSTPETANYITSHSVVLTNLIPDTTYVYQVRSEDAAGNSAVSETLNFATLESQPSTNLKIESVTLMHQDVNGGDWISLPEAGGFKYSYDGNFVLMRATIRNQGSTSVTAAVLFVDAKRNKVLKSVEYTFFPNQPQIIDYQWDTSGYAWEDENTPNLSQQMKIQLKTSDQTTELDSEEVSVQIYPKPLILVHGVWSTAASWNSIKSFIPMTHPNWRPFAVGDGQVAGVMDTGKVRGNPLPINSLEQNANILGIYIDSVRHLTNAWQVDVLAHSMGGLITRRYIHDRMGLTQAGKPVINQVVMLGTPHQGTPCSLLYPFPVMAELTPASAIRFNSIITNRKDVAFFAVAGNNLPFTCYLYETGDLVVTISSALYNFNDTKTANLTHIEMTNNTNLFNTVVKPRLALNPDAYIGLSTQDSNSASTVNSSITSKAVEGPQMLLTEAIEIAAGSTMEVPFDVPQATTFGVTLSAPPEVGTTLLDPSNAVRGTISANSPEANELFRTFRIENPGTGNWKVRLDNQGSVSTNVLLAGWVEGSSILLDLDIGEPSDNNKVSLKATLTQNGTPVTGANTTVELKDTSDHTTSYTLVDDGAHGDGQPGDGIYGVTTNSLAVGDYLVLARAQGPNFTRLTTGSIHISKPGDGGDPTPTIYLPFIVK